ncbi:unnamed protein product [Urochloa humidicola]
MCQIKQEPSSSYEPTTTSSIASTSTTPPSSPPAAATTIARAKKKRPAGRTKFKETRHPEVPQSATAVPARGAVPVGVRGPRARMQAVARHLRFPRRRRGCRLWLGTFDSPDAAARAHDAAMLALRGACGAANVGCLNFPDSAWLLDVPPPAALRGEDGGADAGAVRRAVEGFRSVRPNDDAEDAMSATSGTSATPAAASAAAADGDSDGASSSAKSDEASPFEMDVMSDMGAGLYYASLAQGLLVEPPASDASCGGGDSDCDVAVVPLWSY